MKTKEGLKGKKKGQKANLVKVISIPSKEKERKNVKEVDFGKNHIMWIF